MKCYLFYGLTTPGPVTGLGAVPGGSVVVVAAGLEEPPAPSTGVGLGGGLGVGVVTVGVVVVGVVSFGPPLEKLMAL